MLESLFNKVSDLFSPATLLKRDSHTGYRIFFVKFAKCLRTPILKNICKRLTASLIYTMAYEFSITSFPSILRNSTAEVSIKVHTISLVLNVFK